MNITPILAFAVVAAIFSFGDIISLKTKGIVSSFIPAIFVMIIFGGVLKVLPANLMEVSGLSAIIPTFGMALILTSLGSSLDINDIRREWKTVIVAISGILGIILISFTVGQLLFGKEYALSAIAPVSGGIVAAMITTEAATAAGRPDLAGFVASIIATQALIGLPIASLCLRKAAKAHMKNMHLVSNEVAVTYDCKNISLRIIPKTTKTFDFPTLHLARLALVGAIAQMLVVQLGKVFGPAFARNAPAILFLLCGSIAAATGIIDKGALSKAGGEGIVLLATYASVTASFLTMSVSDFMKIIVPVAGMLILGAMGVCLISSLVGKALKWDPYLSIGVAISCMFGYPMTYAVSMEVINGVVSESNCTGEEKQRLTDYILPKVIIGGIISVSIASVVIAGIMSPIIFK